MIEKPSVCCQCGTYEHCVPMCIHGRVEYIDLCVARLVAALEAGGFRPIASCCGHGKMPPSVLLEDRREVVILTEAQADETIRRYATREES